MMNAPEPDNAAQHQQRYRQRAGWRNPTSSEPTMLRMNPHQIFTRPTRSARPPITTMKMPENNAVMDTAMFMTLVAT
jgi:hypothetical protein